MSKTRHIQQRMSSHEIKLSIMHMIFNCTSPVDDELLLDRKEINKVLNRIEKIKKDAIKIKQKGGLVVVECNDKMVTTYALGSYRR